MSYVNSMREIVRIIEIITQNNTLKEAHYCHNPLRTLFFDFWVKNGYLGLF